MDFVHCNGCGHNPQWSREDGRKYFLTSCGHVFCQNCSSGIQENCPVCRLKCRVLPVSADSKAEIKAYFTDQTDLLQTSLKQFVRVMGFQKTQLKSFKNQVGKLLEIEKALMAENDQLKDEEAELLKKLEILENQEQSWIGNGVLQSSPGDSESGGFMQQPLDPAFASIFEAEPRVQGISFGNRTNTLGGFSDSIQMATPPVTSEPRSTSVNVSRVGGRVSFPFTPISRENLSRYSPVMSSAGSSSLGSTPGRPIRPGQQQQQQQGDTTTPDIMQRLKNLRW